MDNLADEIKQIWTEYGFTSRWAIVEMYSKIGELILSQVTPPSLKVISAQTKISERNLLRAVQFKKKFPDLALLPAGKNTSWHDIVNKYLPEHSDSEKTACEHEFITICKKCKIPASDTPIVN